MSKNLTEELPKATQEQYRVVKTRHARFIKPPFGEVDLRKVTPARAAELVEKGFPYLERIPETKPTAKAKDK